MHEDEAMTANEWFHSLCGWSLTDVADELGIERNTGRQQITEIAHRQVETARLEGVALNFDEVERYLSDLRASIDKNDGDEDEEDSQEDCGRAY
jgi:hypothetical protein